MKNSFFTLFFIVFVCQIASAQYDKYVKFKQKGETYYQQSNYNDAYDAYSTSFNLPEGEGDVYLSKKIEECSEMLDGIDAYENKKFKLCLPLFNKYKNINRDAQFYLGKMYMEGLGIAQDNTQAKKMFLKSANAGHLEAKSIYTQFDAVNTRVVQDYRAFKVKADIYYNEGKYMDAKKLYQKALEEKADANLDLKISSCEEMNAAVNAYRQGNHEFSRTTFEKYKDHRDAQYYTGLMYKNGLLVNKDLQQSKLFFEHALAQGHPEASSKLKEVQNEINLKNSSQYSDKYIEKADMLFGQSEYVNAKKEYEQAMTYQPPNKDYIQSQILACRDVPEGRKAYLRVSF